MALAAAAAIEFNRALDRKFHIQFCDSVIVELLPESVDLVAKPGSQLQKMCQRGVIWIVERQLRSKAFVKLVSNTGAIIQAQECRSARAKKDKMIATAFAHWSWIHSKRRCMFMDLQGAQVQFADVEIVTAEHSLSEFGCGNLLELSGTDVEMFIADDAPAHEKTNRDVSVPLTEDDVESQDGDESSNTACTTQKIDAVITSVHQSLYEYRMRILFL
uniref:Alpha-type protein kinase domain-containing protein n=1 Tax=Spongospora subterranea TaxID=70186 RepID=A0A0H5R269_9EUKA|eukprot:CRZ08291.1 hypothetical protein [Spongospora subterranea]